MMGIAVAEESGFYLGAAIGFVETDDVHIEIHRPIDVRDHQIDMAEPSRLEKFYRLADFCFQFNDVHGSAPAFRLLDAGTLGLTESWCNWSLGLSAATLLVLAIVVLSLTLGGPIARRR